MIKTRTTITALAAAVTLLAAPGFASAQDRPAAPLTARTVVLVHGAFADGSSWNKGIPLLERAGLNVVAMQNPLDSLDGDVAVANRAIAAAQGPFVLVGHSWAGAIMFHPFD